MTLHLRPRPLRSFPSLVVRQALLRPMNVLGISLVLIFVLVALLAPVLAPPTNARQPYLIPRDGFSSTPQPPGSVWRLRPPPLPFWWQTLTGRADWVHLMGTAGGQWDIYYGVIWGTRTALKVGLLVEGFTLAIGLLFGSVAGLRGGWLDETLMRLADLFLGFPALLAALTLSTMLTPLLGKSIWPAVLALIAFGWMGYARLIRGDILAVRGREYVTAAQVTGVSNHRLLLRHLLPNAFAPTLAVASLNFSNDVLAFAALSFLGIGVEAGFAEWGQLLSAARDWTPSLATYWWIVLWPGLALTLFALGWTLLGDALRDWLDPHQS